jgi:predicted transposase YbfD/YdcC
MFAQLNDPRVERTKVHQLIDIVTIALCASIAGCEGWVEIEAFGKAKQGWFARFLKLPGGIPSHDTFGRVFAALDTAEFLSCLKEWLKALHVATAGEIIAVDGKTLAGSFDKGTGKAALHLVSAWAVRQKLILGQVATEEKSNEITAIPKLLETLELLGAIVTLDAMGCQKEIAAKIRAKGADYVLTLKDNHSKLHQTVAGYFLEVTEQNFADKAIRRMVKKEKSHGREETRDYVIAPVPNDLPGREQWNGLKSIGMVVRTRLVDGKESGEVRYYLSSLEPKVRRFAEAVRSHWQIENRLHWSLDVTFSEDKSRIRQGHAAETTGLLRRLALSILQQDTSIKASLRVKRKAAGWDERVLERFLTRFSGD